MNKLTAGSNLKWMSSKFMLHEHNDLLIAHNKKNLRKEKPLIDEQRFDEMTYVIQESISERKKVKVYVFNAYQDELYEGVITNFDSLHRKVKLEFNDDFDWISLSDITDIVLL